MDSEERELKVLCKSFVFGSLYDLILSFFRNIIKQRKTWTIKMISRKDRRKSSLSSSKDPTTYPLYQQKYPIRLPKLVAQEDQKKGKPSIGTRRLGRNTMLKYFIKASIVSLWFETSLKIISFSALYIWNS